MERGRDTPREVQTQGQWCRAFYPETGNTRVTQEVGAAVAKVAPFSLLTEEGEARGGYQQRRRYERWRKAIRFKANGLLMMNYVLAGYILSNPRQSTPDSRRSFHGVLTHRYRAERRPTPEQDHTNRAERQMELGMPEA